MKLDINEIYHQYIIKIVIFSLFLYKRQIRQPNVYKLSVNSFIKKRLAWKINLVIHPGVSLNKEAQREIILEEILNDVETNHITLIKITFTTPLKEVNMEIDLRDEEKYQDFIYL